MTAAQVAIPQAQFSSSQSAIATAGPFRAEGVTDNERHMGVAIHLSPLASFFFWPAFFAPLVLWLIAKDKSVFNDDHGKEIINFGISYLLLHLILMATVIGVLLWPVLWIVGIISLIRGGVAAGRGEYFRYPMTWRFLS